MQIVYTSGNVYSATPEEARRIIGLWEKRKKKVEQITKEKYLVHDRGSCYGFPVLNMKEEY